MRIYLAGPIGGRKDRNLPAFMEGAEFIRSTGKHEVVTPFDIVLHDAMTECATGKDTGFEADDHPYGCYLIACLQLLSTCDMFAMLHDWDASPGARVERAYAHAAKLQQFMPIIGPKDLELGRHRIEARAHVAAKAATTDLRSA